MAPNARLAKADVWIHRNTRQQLFAAHDIQRIALPRHTSGQFVSAAGARGDHRVRSVTSLIEEINTTRAALYGQLATKAAAADLPLDWPSRFFRKSARTKNEPSGDNGPNKPGSVTPKP